VRARQEPNYILFSDVHLGADLVQHVRPWTVSRLKQVARIDRDLASMLDWYRTHRDPGRPWCLVIAGDLVDFIGMSLAPVPGGDRPGELTEDERKHGLGSTREHAATKMRAVAARHDLVFDRFARFVAEGHHLVLVRGNHDLDFYWKAARDAFVQAVLDRVPGSEGDPALRAQVAERIEFHPWFYYVEGLLYVEHGHQFDAVCNYPHLLAPICPADPDRLHWSLSDWLLRVVARPTPGLGSEGHDQQTAWGYLRFAWSLGLVGMMRLAYRYARALTVSLRQGRNALTSRARAIREEHDRRMSELAERGRVRLEHLREVASMWPRPVASRLLGVARNAFLDRLGMAALAVGAVSLLVMSGAAFAYWAPAAAVIMMGYLAYSFWSRRRRHSEVNPTPTMIRAARRIAELLPTRFVVMGHTHEPVMQRVRSDVTYVNLGNWGVDDLDGDSEDAPRTHLVLRWVDGRHRAEFFRWDRDRGPRPVRPVDDSRAGAQQ
jgi:UDP-2,3-diacylglucosamine pyrophosphatase LpxH